MKPSVVDTNVPVVANGGSHVSGQCVDDCAGRLLQIKMRGTVVIDNQWRIIDEYRRHLSPTGQPGPGDRFFKWVLRNQAKTDRCAQVPITPRADDSDDFVEFPADPRLVDFDRHDRKFVAVALACPDEVVVLQAADSEWWHVRDALEDSGVHVEFLCPDDIKAPRRARAGTTRRRRRGRKDHR